MHLVLKWLVIALFSVVFGCSDSDDRQITESIVGRWQAVKFTDERGPGRPADRWVLNVTNNELRIANTKDIGGAVYKIRVSPVDQEGMPANLDVLDESGGASDVKSKGIISVENTQLKIHISLPNQPRPQSFDFVIGQTQEIWVARRL
jgi:uncharacterized protein (TIGR03067 family)